MGATLDQIAPITVAPGNSITLTGSGLVTGGSTPTDVIFDDQGWDGGAQYEAENIVFDPSGDSVTFTVPDGVRSGPLVVTADDGSQATVPCLVTSQYVQAYEFLGQGVDTSTLADQGGALVTAGGELDNVLQTASKYADVFIGQPLGLRYLQTVEQHAWRTFRDDKSRRITPFRRPLVSVESFIVQISNLQFATFPATDIVLNLTQNYMEILSYAVASYTLLGAIQNLGLVANIIKLVYTSGYGMTPNILNPAQTGGLPIEEYPAGLKEATKIIATELLTYRNLQFQGFGGLSSVKQGNQSYDRRQEKFEIPKPAKEMLRPFCYGRLE